MEEKKKILLVDDEEDALLFLSSSLERADFEVVSTTKGKEALELAIKHKPDAIILDIVLPDILGGDIANMMSENPDTKNIPIIFLSGLNTPQDEEIMRQKADEYHILAKPTTSEDLIQTLDKILKSPE